MRLVARGSRDGFDPKTIIDRCKDKGSTMAIFKSDGRNGRVFGCYTDIPWKNDSQWQRGAGESFLFSVRDDGQVKKLPYMNKDDNEIAHHGSALLLAGCGYDLFIKQFCN